jgi:hypothetical protein
MIGIVCIVIALCLIPFAIASALRDSRQTPQERQTKRYGPINPHVVCTHCQTKGNVRIKPGLGTASKNGIAFTAGSGGFPRESKTHPVRLLLYGF